MHDHVVIIVFVHRLIIHSPSYLANSYISHSYVTSYECTFMHIAVQIAVCYNQFPAIIAIYVVGWMIKLIWVIGHSVSHVDHKLGD